MKVYAAMLLASVADADPCLCIFDVDGTLISWSTPSKCPNTQRTGDYSGSYEVLRAEGSHRLSETACGGCYMGVISAGSANSGKDERKDLVKQLKAGGNLPTDTWNPAGCHNTGSPLVHSCSDKPSAVPGIVKYYKDTHGVDIADKDVHFYDDQPYNIVTFEGSPYNAHQVSCGTTGGTDGGFDGGDDKCAAAFYEVNHQPGITYCCGGNQLTPISYSNRYQQTQCLTSCHFPFTYHSKTYNSCTTKGEPAPWCATTSSYDGTHWGYCHGGPSDVEVNQTTSDVVV